MRLVTGKWPPSRLHQFGSTLDAEAIFWLTQFMFEFQIPVAKSKLAVSDLAPRNCILVVFFETHKKLEKAKYHKYHW